MPWKEKSQADLWWPYSKLSGIVNSHMIFLPGSVSSAWFSHFGGDYCKRVRVEIEEQVFSEIASVHV